MTRRISVGDCFAIPLPDGRRAYCQYVQWNDDSGYLVRVFDRITRPGEELFSADLRGARELFPPVFVGLRASVRSGRWKFIGNLSVVNFVFPLFRATNATQPGTYEDWWIFDGKERRFIGKLPPTYRSLEVDVVWGDELLEERIATGKHPFADRR